MGGGAGGMGGGMGGMGGGPGGMGGMGGGPGGMGPMGGMTSVAATPEYVYVVHQGALYQLAAKDLSLVNQIDLPPGQQKAAAAKGRK